MSWLPKSIETHARAFLTLIILSIETVVYSNGETYFWHEIDVYNGPQLPSGIHIFPFSFTLPYNIPSSFGSQVGNVRYEIDGKIVQDWKWDHVRKMITGMYQNTWIS